MYKDVMDEVSWEMYQTYHTTLYKELNVMMFDIAFLQECLAHNNNNLDTDTIISYLFNNIFEHLILKVYRIFFDSGKDVITLDKLATLVIKSINDEQYREYSAQD